MYDDKVMIEMVIDTYNCLLSAICNLPGAKIEDLFNPEGVNDIQNELAWLKKQENLQVKWISVKDRLPDDNIAMTFVIRVENPIPTARLYRGNGEWQSRATVTHWMYIPKPPKE